jgi:tol-pal system protein YbgF
MKYMLLLLPVMAAVAGCASNPADDPVQVRLNDVDARIGKVERVISNQSLLDLAHRLDVLEAQGRELRGSSEVLQNGAEGLQRQQRALYADLERRIASLESGKGGSGQSAAVTGSGTPPAAGAGADLAATVPGTVGAATGSPTGPATDDQAAYTRAFDLLKSGDYAAAITRFQAFMRDYPQSGLVDNAQYWIGESYYVTRDYDRAAAAFRAVGERWPNSRKAGDALLKLGFAQFEQKHFNEARTTLSQVVQRYPGSEAARLAGERLQKLPLESR